MREGGRANRSDQLLDGDIDEGMALHIVLCSARFSLCRVGLPILAHLG
jgi:hypothetical protein